MIRLRGKKCGRCGLEGPDSEVVLTLHHKHYQSLGRELESDVELLCEQCHEKADAEREKKVEAKRTQRRYDAGLNTYATKKYGDDPDYWPADVEEEFGDWIDSRQW